MVFASIKSSSCVCWFSELVVTGRQKTTSINNQGGNTLKGERGRCVAAAFFFFEGVRFLEIAASQARVVDIVRSPGARVTRPIVARARG